MLRPRGHEQLTDEHGDRQGEAATMITRNAGRSTGTLEIRALGVETTASHRVPPRELGSGEFQYWPARRMSHCSGQSRGRPPVHITVFAA